MVIKQKFWKLAVLVEKERKNKVNINNERVVDIGGMQEGEWGKGEVEERRKDARKRMVEWRRKKDKEKMIEWLRGKE